MRRQARSCAVLALMAILHSAHGSAGAEQAAANVTAPNVAATPNFPTCSSGAVQSGNPTSGPSILLGTFDSGCVVPWHWHTSNKYLMMVSGIAEVQSKNAKPSLLTAGASTQMLSKRVYRFRCKTACTLFVHSDAALDTHYVDAHGKELSPEAALKAVKETVAKP